jgi:hypothetical protein
VADTPVPAEHEKWPEAIRERAIELYQTLPPEAVANRLGVPVFQVVAWAVQDFNLRNLARQKPEPEWADQDPQLLDDLNEVAHALTARILRDANTLSGSDLRNLTQATTILLAQLGALRREAQDNASRNRTHGTDADLSALFDKLYERYRHQMDVFRFSQTRPELPPATEGPDDAP